MGRRFYSLIKNTQGRRSILKVLLFTVLFASVVQVGKAQIMTVCDESTFMGYDIFEADKTPNGHRSEGEWTTTGGLTFSNINDPNAMITVPAGFPTPTTVNLVWTYKNGTSSHTFPISISSNKFVGPASLTADGASSDLLLCSKTDVALDADPNGEDNYQFWVIDPVTGMVGEDPVYDGNSDTYSLGVSEYELLGSVFGIIRDANGCTAQTNEVLISDVSAIQVQVVGGISVCQGATIPDVDLEVLPFNTVNFTYNWFFDPEGVAPPDVVDTDVEIFSIDTS
ncbi:MAG: hypothetical protein JEZ14_25705, partial [Marinilabiliaceae bacterium]|nr:hypothetical protein [Marinilabiliaceae bacterium]